MGSYSWFQRYVADRQYVAWSESLQTGSERLLCKPIKMNPSCSGELGVWGCQNYGTFAEEISRHRVSWPKGEVVCIEGIKWCGAI